MGNRLVWQDRYNIGVSFIDEEHKKLFSILKGSNILRTMR